MFFLSRDIFQAISERTAVHYFCHRSEVANPKAGPAHGAQPRGWRVGMTHLCSRRKLLLIIAL